MSARPALWLYRVLFGLFVIALWQFAANHDYPSKLLARSPGQVVDYLGEAIDNGDLLVNLWATMKAVLIAFALASLVGVIIGIALALLPRVEDVISPYLDAVNAMPRIALAPVFITYFGIGIASKVALAFSVVVFMMIVNARAGVRSCDPEVRRLSVVLGASKLQLFWKVYLPVATPSIFAGLRLGIVYSLLGVVASEIIASRNGLGQLIMRNANLFVIEGVYGILLVLAVVSVTINWFMKTVEQRLLRWQPPSD